MASFASVRRALLSVCAALVPVFVPALLSAQEPHAGGEANLRLPDLGSVAFLGGTSGRALLMGGLVVCALGLIFGLWIYTKLKNLPVHRSMLEVSELIYATCRTYLETQGRFLIKLWCFIAAIIAFYFYGLQGMPVGRVGIILAFSLVGMAGSYLVAWFGIRVNTFANSRTAFAALKGKPYPCYDIPLQAGMSIGMLLISVELLLMLVIMRIDYRYLRLLSVPALIVALILLVIVLVPTPVGPFRPIFAGGSYRWLQIGPLPAMHPGELAKLAIVVYLAHWLAKRGSKTTSFGEGLVPFRTLDEAADGAERIIRNYAAHTRAARAVAESCFDSDKVLRQFLREAGVEIEGASPRRSA
jgi:hypothetical protein